MSLNFIMSVARYGCLFFLWMVLPLTGGVPKKWTEQTNAKVLDARMLDGDSFGMTVDGKTGKPLKRTYRLYGVDCPESDESDPAVKDRIDEQAKHFGVPAKDIPVWGKKAAEVTKKLLSEGNPKVHTFGPTGEEVKKANGRPQRYLAVVEVTADDGKRRLLHEILLEQGLARAHGYRAPWPEETLKKVGKAKAGNEFMEDLEKAEARAKRARAGIWKGRR